MVLFNVLNHCQGGSTGDWIASKGREGEGLVAISHFGSGNGGANRNTVSHSLGKGHHIRLHVPVRNAEHGLASASPTCLDFINDQQATILLNNALDFLEILFGRRDESADTLNRFCQQASNLAGSGRLN